MSTNISLVGIFNMRIYGFKKKAASCYCLFLILSLLPLQGWGQVTYEDAYPHLTFNHPVDFQTPPDQQKDVYVVEQAGQIHAFVNDSTTKTTRTFLDIQNRVLSGGEQGLLGMAFHPQYPDTNYIYVDYTRSNPRRTVISRFTVDVSGIPDAREGSEKVILEVRQPYGNHNGGKVAFGPDGYLYVSFGDGGSAGDPGENGQDRTTLLGSIIRIDVDTSANGRNYGIPDSNPFVGEMCGSEACRGEIYAYGLRNPWRFSFDPETGRLWAGDVGQSSYEEVNIIRKGGNYGWDIMEGRHCYEPSSGCDRSGLILPVWEYSHKVGRSITGGVVYRGKNIPELTGKYLVADFVENKVWSLEYDGETVTESKKLFNAPNISAFGTDRQGEVYMCSFDGNIYKLRSTSSADLPKSEQPSRFKLYPNYPNPFNPVTKITYAIPGVRRVIIDVFDVNGERIQTYQQGYRPAGKYTVEINFEGLSSGTYFYKVRAGSQQRYGSMTLVK